MDDSERSHGYSQDIYHGQRGAGGHYDRTREDGGTDAPERSYEYGPESEGFPDSKKLDQSPEEAAIYVDKRGLLPIGGSEPGPPGPREETGYDHDRSGSAEVDSYTWKDTREADRKDGKS